MKIFRFYIFLVLATASARAENRFVAAGAPAPDREWVGSDYVAFAAALRSGGPSFPTLSDPEGKEIVQRIVNHANFGFYKNRAIPVPQRLQSFLEFQEGLNATMLAYVGEANRGSKLQGELAELLAMTLYTSTIMLDLLDEFIEAVPVEENKHEQREAGLRQVRNGLISIVNGAVVSLSERKFYSSTDLSLILRAMAETLPRLTGAFSENQMVELRKRLEQRKAEFQTKADLEGMNRLLEALIIPGKAGRQNR